MLIQVHPIPNASDSNSSLAQAGAAEHLGAVRIYAFGGVGFTGTTSPGEALYRTVLAAPVSRAILLFQEIYRHGTPESKAYALTGLHAISPFQYKELAAEARTSNQPVTTMRGCIVSHRPLKEVVAEIDRSPRDRH